MFEVFLKNRSGVIHSVTHYEDTWISIHDGRVNLTISELIPELRSPSSTLLSVHHCRELQCNAAVRNAERLALIKNLPIQRIPTDGTLDALSG